MSAYLPDTQAREAAHQTMMITPPGSNAGLESKNNGETPSEDSAKEEGGAAAAEQSSPWPKQVWKKSGLNVDLLSTMFKYVSSAPHIARRLTASLGVLALLSSLLRCMFYLEVH